jgi:hypothetical protein
VPLGTGPGDAFAYPYPYFSLFHRTARPTYASRMEDGEVTAQLGDAAIRDAEEILLRTRNDEHEADEARVRYRADGLPRLAVDGPITDLLRPGETVVDLRPSAVVSRHVRGDGTEQLPGRLYLTSQRLLLVGRAPLAVELGEIEELALAGERLLVTLRGSTGLAIDASRPRLLRVQIAAALAAGRT